jgi:hypothetical protein
VSEKFVRMLREVTGTDMAVEIVISDVELDTVIA